MKKPFSKLLSLLLAVALLVQLVPTWVFATEAEQDVESMAEMELAEDRTQTAGESLQAAQILFEEVDLREQNTKHFRLDDGTYIAVQYDMPVHYLDENGEWEDYDNTLHAVQAPDGSGETAYRVVNGDSVRVFAADTNAETLLAVQKGDYALSLTPVEEPAAELPIDPNPPVIAAVPGENELNAQTVEAGQTEPIQTEELPLQTATVLEFSAPSAEEISDPLLAQTQPEALYSALEYANAFNGATLRYENYANTIKESIVISAPQTEYVYSFRLKTEGLTPALQTDGSITLCAADGSAVYRIPAPYLIDAKQALSYDAAYTLTASGSEWLLTVTADADWLNATDRAFPVLLDPTLEEEVDTEKLAAGFVRKGIPTAPDTTDPGLYVGDNGNENGLTRSYIHVNELPLIPEGCVLNQAMYYMYHYAQEPDGPGSALEIGLYGLTYADGLTGESTADAWNAWADGLTWSQVQSNLAKHSEILVDKQKTTGTTIEAYKGWDITTLAHKWYTSEGNSENMGFVLKVINEEEVFSRSTFYGPGHSYCRPYVLVRYKSAVGLESYFNYQSFGIGRAGVSNISDCSMQNTLVVPLVYSDSDVMPFSLSLVYNSGYGGRYFTEDIPTEQKIQMLHTKDYSKMRLGIGWKLSAQQTVVEFEIGNTTYLIYTDADGTEHYFNDREQAGVYKDEDGLDYEITISGTNYTMTSKMDHKWYFANGYLTWEEDAHGNRISYVYDSSKRLKTVTRRIVGSNETKTLASLTYRETANEANPVVTNLLTYVVDENNRTTQLQYATETTNDGPVYYFRRLNFPDGCYADYTYLLTTGMYPSRRLYRAYDAESEYGIEYSYSYNGDVRNIYEYTTASRIYGAKLHGYKRSPSQTVYRYYGKDQNPGTTDDELLFCVLDTEGRTRTSYVTDYTEGNILAVSTVNYTENSGTDERNNHITAAVSGGVQGVNLLQDSGAERAMNKWSGGTVQTNASHVYYGAKSFSVTNSSLKQTVSLTGNKTYSFSAYVKATNGATARLELRNGNSVVASSESLNYDASGVNDGWVRLSLSYTTESGGSYQAVVVATGTVYADALQLEEGYASSTYNPLEDPSFETANSSSPLGGWYGAGASTTRTPNEGETFLFGSRAAVLKGASGLQRIHQNIPLNLPLESGFVLSAWAKGAALPGSVDQKTEETDPYFGLILRLNFSDGDSEVYYQSFDPYCLDWQYAEDIVVPEKENNAQGSITITDAVVVVSYDNNINSALIDHVSLRLEQAREYDHDEEGNTNHSSETGEGEKNAIYDEETNDLTRYTAENGNVATYTYNNTHDRLTATAAGTVSSYTYENSGFSTGARVDAVDAANYPQYLTSSATATEDKNRTATVTDTEGNTTEFTYEANRLATTKNAKGITTTYVYYHQNDRPKDTYTSGIASIHYTYDKGQLTQLTRKSFRPNGTVQEEQFQNYNFTYNPWGQRTSVSVGNQTLASFVYENVNSASPTGGGNQTQMTYGNGNSISYEYDSFDRLVKTVYNDTKEYVEYVYNAEGNLAKLTHRNEAGEVLAHYEYERDSLGRLIRSRQTDGNGTTVQHTEQLYDGIGRLSTQRWTLGSTTYSESYTYNDGETGNGKYNTVTLGTTDQVVHTYNALNQLREELVKSSNGVTLFKTAYAYEYLGDNRTSNQLQFRNVRFADGSLLSGYRYSYDEMGNITEIAHSEGGYYPLVRYTYDDQSQLLSETFYDGNGTGDSHITERYSYTYDTAGNILTVKKGSVLLKTYTYSTGDWKDLLTSVTTGSKTHHLTYDAIGNPTTYGNGSKLYTNLTWQHGRQLTSLTTGGKTYTYDYDADGIRTQKVVDGVTHTYTTLNGKVMQEIIGSGSTAKRLDFIYDESGRPFALKYYRTPNATPETYYYILNAQGDVVKLVEILVSGNSIWSFDKVAEYSYNAWGELVSITDYRGNTITDPTHIGSLNPLRYRGYYYDSETGFYYLQSRYYDPVNCRFINADSIIETEEFISFNLFCYCDNNPTIKVDHAGKDGLVIDLGDGWYCRIDAAKEGTGTKRHIHIWNKNKEEYSQNDDGSPHDKKRGKKGMLPKKVNKKVKEKTGWDYNDNRNSFYKLTEIGCEIDGYLFKYPDGTEVCRPFMKVGYLTLRAIETGIDSKESYYYEYYESSYTSVTGEDAIIIPFPSFYPFPTPSFTPLIVPSFGFSPLFI